MNTIETDYLVVGAGASGMAFTDALVADSDSRVVMVDRRHAPGGHWNDAYPFVRLHQPSAVYGVNSVHLGEDRIDTSGVNAGFYEQASAPEICHYYQRVLAEQLLGSGRVRFLGRHDYVGEDRNGYRLRSCVTGEETFVRARKVVDATYVESSVPATHEPNFEVAPGALVVTPNDLVRLRDLGDGFTVLGGGKTAMDTCTWLLEQRVDPDDIRWVRPREAWVLDRAFTQPLTLVVGVIEGMAGALEAAAEANDLDDLYVRAEACGQIHRLDPDVEPDMFHAPTLSEAERVELGRIGNVVRMGRVRRVEPDELVLDGGTVATTRREVHIDCTAAGLGLALPRPIFEERRITPQYLRLGQVPFNAALIGFLESSGRDDGEKNRLAQPNPIPRTRTRLDWAWATYIAGLNQDAWRTEPDIQAWIEGSRLNLAGGLADHLDDPRMQPALTRLITYWDVAMANLERLLVRQPATVT